MWTGEEVQTYHIHSIVNASSRLALSLNLYGVSYAAAQSEKFDPQAQTVKPLLAP